MPDIEIRLGDQPHNVPEGSNLAELIAALNHAPTSVASAVNGDFVRRERRAATGLQPGDRVLLVRPIVGG
ncbi:sulfur carrier protein ThiS [Xylophilus sp. GOD-11R]|uniref:sulfur carrier protein ThiS n=1 Tax=Xylophilus sp. GOD-11R TaxID=3089814 RepID=UPI00298C6696|nr:sulfur carrier protein ThiS [Xylophilus sp. GOD-11R]WPB57990.1 sulfur carrier protein ThiS [Xylophilus sp. GOD-11R]